MVAEDVATGMREIGVRVFFHSRTPQMGEPSLQNCTLTPMALTAQQASSREASVMTGGYRMGSLLTRFPFHPERAKLAFPCPQFRRPFVVLQWLIHPRAGTHVDLALNVRTYFHRKER